jgi:hypothetical protein
MISFGFRKDITTCVGGSERAKVGIKVCNQHSCHFSPALRKARKFAFTRELLYCVGLEERI